MLELADSNRTYFISINGKKKALNLFFFFCQIFQCYRVENRSHIRLDLSPDRVNHALGFAAAATFFSKTSIRDYRAFNSFDDLAERNFRGGSSEKEASASAPERVY
jgi:hypothetical protein